MSTDPRSTRSNEILNALLDEPKKLGKENSQHKPTLEDEELEKLKSTDALSHNNPLSILANSGFILFFTSADEALKDNESCRNPATNWKSMGAGEIT